MKKLTIAIIVGFIATFITNTILAIIIIGPLFNEKIGIGRNPEKDGLNFPAILFGYFALTIFIVWLTTILTNKNWLQKGIIAGGATGLAVFVAGHSIVAGWSVADAGAMIIAGIIDSLAAIVGGITIAFILRNR